MLAIQTKIKDPFYRENHEKIYWQYVAVISVYEDGALDRCLTCSEGKCQMESCEGGWRGSSKVPDRPGRVYPHPRPGWTGGGYTRIPKQR
jgi:hypothetical protein